MDQDQFEFLKQVVETTGPSGYEWDTQAVWRNRVADVAESMQTDPLGNCTAVLNGEGSPRVLLDAHIDEIGFIVRYIDDSGFLHFAGIGGFDAATLPGSRVRIMGKQGPVIGVIGRKGVHLMDAEERKKAPEAKQMWIDIGVRDREEAEQLVSVGDAGGRCAGLERLHGTYVAANSFDDRVGSYVIAEVLREVARRPVQAALLAASTTQEEIGLRGARTAAYASNADIGIAIDVTSTSDIPYSSKQQVGDLRVGGGPILARGPNTNPRVFRALLAAADAVGLPYQLEGEPTGTGTDQHVMDVTRAGMATGLLSIPTRYLHSASEVLCLDDVDAAVQVLVRFVRDLGAGFDVTP